MKNKSVAKIIALMLVAAFALNLVACGGGNNNRTSVDGTYYLYIDGDYDEQSSLTIKNGNVTEISLDGIEVLGRLSTKITGANIRITSKVSFNNREYVQEFIGTVNNDIICITEMNALCDGAVLENRDVTWYFCKNGKVPPVDDDTNDDNTDDGEDGNAGEKYAGVTETTIYVGNTTPVAGAFTGIGATFNYGINAAFWEYNQNGGFSGIYDGKSVSGLNVALRSYSDDGNADKSIVYMQRLIERDEVFAIVGNFGAYAVDATVDMIKHAGVPMVYAAANSEIMANETAIGEDRYIFPVQPMNSTEGSVLIKRAFAATDRGGLGAVKVGVISNNDDVSVALLNGIENGAYSLTAAQRANIVYRKVDNSDYASAASALKSSGCDVVIIALATDYLNTVKALVNAGFNSRNVKILTTYNNSSTYLFDVTERIGSVEVTHFDMQYADIIDAIYTQGWIDITDDSFIYNTDGGLLNGYKALAASSDASGLYDNGVIGFCEEYWHVAEVMFDFGIANPNELPTGQTAFTIGYNSFALTGYIAGNLFCQGLELLGDKALTRSNYVDVMESRTIDLALAGTVSYENGQRLGIQSFTLNRLSAPYGSDGVTEINVVHGFTEF